MVILSHRLRTDVGPRSFSDQIASLFSIASCAGLTRASIVFRKKMDCRVKPGNDRGSAYRPASAGSVLRGFSPPLRRSPTPARLAGGKLRHLLFFELLNYVHGYLRRQPLLSVPADGKEQGGVRTALSRRLYDKVTALSPFWRAFPPPYPPPHVGEGREGVGLVNG